MGQEHLCEVIASSLPSPLHLDTILRDTGNPVETQE